MCAEVAQWLKEHSSAFQANLWWVLQTWIGTNFLVLRKALCETEMNEWLTEAVDEFYPTFEHRRSTIKSNYGYLH